MYLVAYLLLLFLWPLLLAVPFVTWAWVRRSSASLEVLQAAAVLLVAIIVVTSFVDLAHSVIGPDLGGAHLAATALALLIMVSSFVGIVWDDHRRGGFLPATPLIFLTMTAAILGIVGAMFALSDVPGRVSRSASFKAAGRPSCLYAGARLVDPGKLTLWDLLALKRGNPQWGIEATLVVPDQPVAGYSLPRGGFVPISHWSGRQNREFDLQADCNERLARSP
jgi:hypothetical protein